ncbi:MAG: acyl-CoA desaturase [Leptospirales bacterium]
MSILEDKQLLEELTERLEKTDFFNSSYPYYTIKIIILFCALCFVLPILLMSKNPLVITGAILCWSFLSGQFGMIGHDAGHNATSKNLKLNKFYGYLSLSFVNGSSYYSWLFQHKSHHRYTNIMKADLDIKSNLFIAYFPDEERGDSKIIKRVKEYQHYYFWLFISTYMFYKRITSLYIAIRYIKKAKFDIVFIVMHYLIMLILPAYILGLQTAILYYLLYSIVLSIYYSLIFSVNHLGLYPVLPNSKVTDTFRHLLNHTRTINNQPYLDFLFGGLNYHIEHHLFPNVSINRYKKGSVIIKDFCHKKDIPYHNLSFSKALAGVYRQLQWASHKEKMCGEEKFI